MGTRTSIDISTRIRPSTSRGLQKNPDKMSPNLMLLCYKISRPTKRFIFNKTDKEPVLHYYSSPIPGIYEDHPKHGRILCYVKANKQRMAGAVRFEDLFVSKANKECNSALDFHYVVQAIEANGLWENDLSTTDSASLLALYGSEDDEEEDEYGPRDFAEFELVARSDGEVLAGAIDAGTKTSTPTSTSQPAENNAAHPSVLAPTSSLHSIGPSTSTRPILVNEIDMKLTRASSSIYSNSSTNSRYKTSWSFKSATPSISRAKAAKQSLPFKATQISTIPSTCKTCNSSSSILSSFTAPYVHNNNKSIDLDGYRLLRHHLPVHKNHITGRWMFSAESRVRTSVHSVALCPKCCQGGDCGHSVEKRELEFFLLDDARSWVLTGRAPRGKDAKMKKSVRLGKGMGERKRMMESLWVVDEKTQQLRVQTTEEIGESRALLVECRGSILGVVESEGEEGGYSDVYGYYFAGIRAARMG